MKLALGTAQFGLNYGIANVAGQVSIPGIAAILEIARLKAVDTIDTAAAYGNSEARLGQAGVSGFKIVTKLPPMPDDVSDPGAWTRSQIQASLERLGVSSLHGYLMHRPDQLGGRRGAAIAGALVEAKQDGLVSRIGISIYDPEQISAAMGHLVPDIIQAPFNLLDRRIVESGWARQLRSQGIELHTRSSFLQGLLLMGRDALPPYFSRWSGLFAHWYDWLENTQMPATRACLQFACSIAEVYRVVVGVDTADQLAMLADGMKSADGLGSVAWPGIESGDLDLINPARWTPN